MKKKEFNELKNRSAEELKKRLTETQEKLWGLKKDLVSGKVKNVGEIKELKKTIARILTFLNK